MNKSKIPITAKERIIKEQRENSNKDRLLAGCVYEVWKKDDPTKNYIGKTWVANIVRRGYMGSGTAIKAALKKYGPDSFDIKILAILVDDFEALRVEEKLIEAHDPYYNISLGGSGILRGYNNGNKKRIFTDEEVALVKKLLKEGYSQREVRSELKAGSHQWERLLVENNIEWPDADKYRKYKTKENIYIIERLRYEAVDFIDIEKITGIPDKAISIICSENNIPKRFLRRPKPYIPVPTQHCYPGRPNFKPRAQEEIDIEYLIQYSHIAADVIINFENKVFSNIKKLAKTFGVSEHIVAEIIKRSGAQKKVASIGEYRKIKAKAAVDLNKLVRSLENIYIKFARENNIFQRAPSAQTGKPRPHRRKHTTEKILSVLMSGESLSSAGRKLGMCESTIRERLVIEGIGLVKHTNKVIGYYYVDKNKKKPTKKEYKKEGKFSPESINFTRLPKKWK